MNTNSLRATIIGVPQTRAPAPTAEQRLATAIRQLHESREEIAVLRGNLASVKATNASLWRQLQLKIQSFERSAMEMDWSDPEPTAEEFNEPTRRASRTVVKTVRRSDINIKRTTPMDVATLASALGGGR